MLQQETKAFVCNSQGSPLELTVIPLPPLKPTEVQVRIQFSGLCHTDIHMKNNDWGITTYPLGMVETYIVPGHEGVGTVVALGSEVKTLKVNDWVGIGWIRDSCKHCSSCIIGKDNLCTNGYQGTYLGRNATIFGKSDCNMMGTFSEFVQIESRYLKTKKIRIFTA